MLGMATHEPHFSLLREEVKFGKNQKKQASVDTITFHLLHLSILREYLYYEFCSIKVIYDVQCMYILVTFSTVPVPLS